ncbi:probable protein phosphatase 2C 27 [Malania oleifera]|uniref:probable protein phosphatase 2C 27 n=1 Tax=Malania oleifera TaxID=397392 RepID=UPI0025ADCA55|nr:probable protein phosphatase 2C 27 [Malania oleifera]XP_057963808.1 probable protein phosphatase 2C 27 [Malania oleifera]XP_057963809.1 probable protein phosphatase 2C 27 [Malania oleifera]XP_057963810.1 probable protein phosphatase 2C 27 [Malania oleifera]XP_057963811.1 probable protein phosphatase 2C 27 [Malania oleifera]XP_057963812.1 probable protein phosphatase 2C 27 [Malania oleifera]
MKTAGETNYTPLFNVLEGNYRKKNETVSNNKNSETLESLKHVKISKPPRHRSGIQHCVSSTRLASAAELELDIGFLSIKTPTIENSVFEPVFRSGSCSEIGPKPYMEDEHICVDDLLEHLGVTANFSSPGAFYGVFDGHGGTDAALFIRENILRFIVEDSHFPMCVKMATKSAFLKADHAFANSVCLDSSSGTTVLTALMFGRTMIIANAGDCRAVLGKRGRAIELSKDHKPNCPSERLRIERLGGVVYDGYLNGQLSVARALGDWHMKGPKASSCPLSAEPELLEMVLTEEDEFLIMGCDGLWDVMSSQCAVTIVRKELMLHNDPERCSRELVSEALKRNTCDNLTVVVVCFSPDPPPRMEIPKFKLKRSISAEGLNLLQEVLESNV